MLCATSAEDWEGTDAVLEVGNPANAGRIFEHLKAIGVGMFGQKVGWERVRGVDDVPTSHCEGSLFVSRRDPMPW